MNIHSSVLFSVTPAQSVGALSPERASELPDISGVSPGEVDSRMARRRVCGLLHCIAGRRELHENKTDVIRRVARACRIPESRMEDIWYGEVKSVRDYELMRIERAAQIAKPASQTPRS